MISNRHTLALAGDAIDPLPPTSTRQPVSQNPNTNGDVESLPEETTNDNPPPPKRLKKSYLNEKLKVLKEYSDTKLNLKKQALEEKKRMNDLKIKILADIAAHFKENQSK